jgi:hypothetical protein
MWGEKANCYAYACNEDHPANGIKGAAVPGGIAKQGVFAKKDETPEGYADRLVAGVTLDGGHNNIAITVSHDIAVLPNPGTGYVIAMVSNAAGFHFFRRSADGGTWSWKDGIGEDVADKTFFLTSNASMAVNDAAFRNMVGPLTRANYVPNWPMMTFRAYFGIDNVNGMNVAGIKEAGDVMP